MSGIFDADGWRADGKRNARMAAERRAWAKRDRACAGARGMYRREARQLDAKAEYMFVAARMAARIARRSEAIR